MAHPVIKGGCLCGAVRYRLLAPPRRIIACHCGQCRRWHGHFGAYTAVPAGALALTRGDDLAWYRSSPAATRGFCRACGSSLFWRADGRDHVAVAAGSLDDAGALRLAAHIFVVDKAAYYDILDDLPQHLRGLG